MSEKIDRFKRRQAIKKPSKQSIKTNKLKAMQPVKADALKNADSNKIDPCIYQLEEAYRIYWNDLRISDDEATAFIDQFNDKEAAIDALIEPAFLSLIDGTMRAFKMGTRQGLTATRIYNECKNFSYEQTGYVDPSLDRFTEYLNVRDNRQKFGETATYNGKSLIRNGETYEMRNQTKMDNYKKDYFADRDTAPDEYSPRETIFRNNKVAFESYGREYKSGYIHHQSAESDHIIPCKVLFEELKSNKALNPQDLKEILNDDSNLAVTSRDINNGKRCQTNEEYIQNKIKKNEDISDEEIETMTRKSQEARSTIDKLTNQKVVTNVISNKTVQARLSKDASGAAGNRAIGDAIIFFIKPLYFELKDCLTNGIENGVDASDFKQALTIRTNRMKIYVEKNTKGMFKGTMRNFVSSFFSMLIEGILQSFVGIFKHIARAVSEGIRIFIRALPILRDKTKSAAEKGDAILKIVAFSSTALIGIGIEAMLNQTILKGQRSLSIIAASILSTVIMALVMYALDKVDLFKLKRNVKRARIEEALNLIREETAETLDNLLDPGSKFTSLQTV